EAGGSHSQREGKMRVKALTLGLATVAASAMTAAAPAHAAPAPIAIASTSSFVAYSGTTYSGDSVDINGCGLHTIRYHGSYKWYARGQSGPMFNNSTGSGAPHTRLSSSSNAESPNRFGWQSILIVC